MRKAQVPLLSSVFGLSLLLLLPMAGFAAEPKDETAFLQADQFDYDQQQDIFVATGHVELEQDDQMVFADTMTYDRRNDLVTASGNVVFVDKQGQAYFADKVKLEQKLKKGMVEQIGLVFSDGSRFAASSGEQINENKIELHDAVYSPCNLCKDDPMKPPMWQLRAGKITHDKEAQDVIYHNAKMEVYGKPVLYTPYFSHPDPDVKSRSGLLVPQFSSDSKKGFMLRNYYYQNFNPQSDATFEVTNTQKAGSVLGAEWRKRFTKGELLFNGSINRSAVRGGSNDDTIIKPEKWRGHYFAEGEFDLNQKWRTGFNVRRTLDDYYLRDFNYDPSDVLTNNIYAERFSGRDYTNISAYYFQDLRPDIFQEQPNLLPFVVNSMTGDPNNTLGGRWAMDNQFITLFRDGNQSVSRLSSIPSWQRHDILPGGVEATWTNKVRADGYWIRKDSPFDAAPGDPNVDKTVARIIPSTHLNVGYPLIRPGKTISALIEPKAAITLMPNYRFDNDIPNEDSRDVQIDISNLFNDSRFPGSDRVETGSHVSYGLRTGGYHANGNSAFATVGQSYRLTDNNPFPVGSGLENGRSDLVGQFEATLYDQFYADYRFQLNEQDFDDRRHEVQAAYLGDGIELRTNYIFAQEVQGTGLLQDRQQLGFSAAKSLTPKWTIAADTLHDLSGDSGMLKAGSAIEYKNECFRLTLRGERDLTDRRSGGSDSTVMFSVGLRNLGGYDLPLLNEDPLYRPFRDTERR